MILLSLRETNFSKVSMDHATPSPFLLQPSAINRFRGNDAPSSENTRLTAHRLLLRTKNGSTPPPPLTLVASLRVTSTVRSDERAGFNISDLFTEMRKQSDRLVHLCSWPVKRHHWGGGDAGVHASTTSPEKTKKQKQELQPRPHHPTNSNTLWQCTVLFNSGG